MSIRSTLISLAGVGALTFAATPALAETSEAGQQSVLEQQATKMCRDEFHLWVFGNVQAHIDNCVDAVLEENAPQGDANFAAN